MNYIIYEQPLNERIRIFLRLEFLFAQIDQTLYGELALESRTALAHLIDILNIFNRSDLKTEVIIELERQMANLTRLENSPDVDHDMLNEILDEMDLLADRLHATQGQIGQQLRQNEFICSIKQRSSISGGTCDFDLPAYHFWLQQMPDNRINELQHWLSEFDTVSAAIKLILQLVRDSASPSDETAVRGFFQQALDSNLPYQLIRVALTETSGHFAEISGGKHRFTIRFMTTDFAGRPTQTDDDVDFILTSCVI